MKTKLNERVIGTAPNGFAVFLGTSANKGGIAIRNLEHIYGMLSPADKLKITGFDAQGVIATFPVPMVQSDMNRMILGVNEFVPAVLPDPESLEKAERTGKLWPMGPGWYKKPGVSKDNLGTGGTPRNGRGMINLNINRVRKKIRRNLRDCGDYQLQRQLMDKSKGKKATSTTITVVVCLSLLGGFGTGTSITLLRLIREEALALKLPIKIIVLGMVLGSIEPTDREIAARNQSTLLRELNAILVGQYSNVGHDNQIYQPLCDSVILISNANNFGEFNSLDKLIALAAQYIFYLFHTTLGQAIQEKTVDIEESWPKDDVGGRRCGSTMSLSKIHLDMLRAICCIANMLVMKFLKRLLVDEKQPQAIKDSSIMTSEQSLAETMVKSLACERLHRLSNFGNADARQRAIISFTQRTGKRWGFKHCCDLENASSYTLNVEMRQRLIPQMQQEAGKYCSSVKSAIGNKVLMMLTTPDGIAKSTQFLKALTEHITGFIGANHKKLEVVQAKKKSIDDMLGRARDMQNRLKGKFWLWRLLSFSTKGEIVRIFSVYMESAIRNRLEIAARLLLANEVYPEVQKFIEEQLTQINEVITHITVGQKDIGGEVDRLRVFEPILMVPLGSELVTEQFIDQQFNRVSAEEGGPEVTFERIFTEFYSLYKNLIAFNYRSWDEIRQTLLEHCTSMAHRHLCTLNVADVLKESCKSIEQLKERIAQCMHESSGRLRIVGEADEIIPTIKFIGANDRNTGEWIANMANEIDTSNGDWLIIEINDPYTIVLFQQRCRISLTRMIADTDKLWEMSDSLVERAKLGSDPIRALIPTADCPIEDVCTTIAMGLVSEGLKLSEKGYELNGQNGGPILLGTGLDEIICGLKGNYRLLVSLYGFFVNGLAFSRNDIEQRLNRCIQNVISNDDLLLTQLGKEPFIRVQETVDALMPYLRRMPLNHSSNTRKCQE